ncbi:response regulator transcription factor [Candidatus Woesearchaeota archaeon]|nr:response regulator transcription factor [Candidatus Woesearchaeota archaeon]
MKKILYVEDNKDTANAVKTVLANAGFNVEIAPNGNQCLRKSKNPFDLYILDIMLPDMSGWDLFEKLKENNTKSKFVFLSVIPMSTERIKELRRAGVSDCITKPFGKSDLISRIKKILR